MLQSETNHALHRDAGFPGFNAISEARQKALGLPQVTLHGDNVVTGCFPQTRPHRIESSEETAKTSAEKAVKLPVPLGQEPLLHPFSKAHDDYPTSFHPERKSVGIFTVPAESPQEFARKYPTLVEYNRRVASGDHESDNFAKAVQQYAKTLSPQEREQIAKEFEQYTKELDATRRGLRLTIHQPEPGPHLKAYTEQVEHIKHAVHAAEQARRERVAVELGAPYFVEAKRYQHEYAPALNLSM
jgi:hypothetical protein